MALLAPRSSSSCATLFIASCGRIIGVVIGFAVVMTSVVSANNCHILVLGLLIVSLKHFPRIYHFIPAHAQARATRQTTENEQENASKTAAFHCELVSHYPNKKGAVQRD